MELQNYRDCGYTCNPHKLEIPALRFPCRVPVIPCKHLQCIFSSNHLTVIKPYFSIKKHLHLEKWEKKRKNLFPPAGFDSRFSSWKSGILAFILGEPRYKKSQMKEISILISFLTLMWQSTFWQPCVGEFLSRQFLDRHHATIGHSIKTLSIVKGFQVLLHYSIFIHR